MHFYIMKNEMETMKNLFQRRRSIDVYKRQTGSLSLLVCIVRKPIKLITSAGNCKFPTRRLVMRPLVRSWMPICVMGFP